MTQSADTVDSHLHDAKNEDGSWKYTNRLVNQTSPYLLQHAHNPVDWYPWGREAFEKARQEDKPIFVSIGYSTCYWCHVMERQVFEDPDIAAQMNEQFISIKVDREERPDVDDIYMMATQLMTRHGGWPMSVFLTPPGAAGADDPGLKPFFAGTYFPPKPSRGMPGFPQILEGLSDVWRHRRGDAIKQADQVSDHVRQALRNKNASGPIDAALVQDAVARLLRRYDQVHGGFGGAPKFPTPNNLTFLLEVYRNNGEESIWEVIEHTLDRMARGGMYDQVGGGFHRYSTDEKWLVPHFEKMLYDNGQLLELYAAAYDHRPKDEASRLYTRVLRETCEYVLGEMTDPTGAFWSAQDAEVDAREGGNYVWIREQVEEAISDEQLAALAVRMYGLDRGSNFRDPHHPDAEPVNVIYLPRPLRELAGGDVETLIEKRRQINSLLKVVRDRRDQPATDDKVLVAWNGLMIGGMAAAGRSVDEPKYVDAAAHAAKAIMEHMSTADGGLYRTMRGKEAKIPAFLEDYAFFAHGLIELHRTTEDQRKWIELAKRYTQIAIEQFEAEGGGYYDTLPNQADLFVRTRGASDGAIPSGNSQMIHNLVDLYVLTGDQSYIRRAVRDLRSFAQHLKQFGDGMAHMEHALLKALEAAPSLIASGPPPARPRPTPTEPVVVSVEPAEIDLGSSRQILTVTVNVHDDYHINSNVPSEDFLIPTTVKIVGASGLSLDAEYPNGRMKMYPFSDKPLSIYEGQVTVRATLRKVSDLSGDAAPRLVVRYQACTETTCLAPTTVEVPLTIK